MTPFLWVAVAVVATLSTARLTRLAVHDLFPPVAYVRNRFIAWADDSDRRRAWLELAYCNYCAAPYFAALVMGTGYLSGWTGPWGAAWWLVNGVLAVSYPAAILVTYDGQEAE